MNHTPTPWKIVTDDKESDKNIIADARGNHIARTYGYQKEYHPNAQFIVTACNAHEDLVKALEDVREYFADCADASSEGDPLEFKPNKEMTILDSIEKALAKAGAL